MQYAAAAWIQELKCQGQFGINVNTMNCAAAKPDWPFHPINFIKLMRTNFVQGNFALKDISCVFEADT